MFHISSQFTRPVFSASVQYHAVYESRKEIEIEKKRKQKILDKIRGTLQNRNRISLFFIYLFIG